MKKLILAVILVTILFCCKNSKDKKLEILINSFGKEWRLEKVKGKSPKLYSNRYFLIFHQDSSYEVYYKKNDQREDILSDVIFEEKWFFNENGNLVINAFPNLKLIKLKYNYLVFEYNKVKYEFFCKECR
jgi:hypothetical protein